jgi:hypothetical protein
MFFLSLIAHLRAAGSVNAPKGIAQKSEFADQERKSDRYAGNGTLICLLIDNSQYGVTGADAPTVTSQNHFTQHVPTSQK